MKNSKEWFDIINDECLMGICDILELDDFKFNLNNCTTIIPTTEQFYALKELVRVDYIARSIYNNKFGPNTVADVNMATRVLEMYFNIKI